MYILYMYVCVRDGSHTCRWRCYEYIQILRLFLTFDVYIVVLGKPFSLQVGSGPLSSIPQPKRLELFGGWTRVA